jgi:hypothetical protein
VRLTIHQPEFLPWLGFLHKMDRADTVVILDDIQYRHQYFQNRNKIRTADGWTWLIVPVKHQPLDEWRINSVTIDEKIRWQRKITGSIEVNYAKCSYFKEYWSGLKEILNNEHTHLLNLNMEIIQYLFSSFNIHKRIIFSSDFGLSTKKGDLILDICKKAGATTYISGISGRDYLDMSRFSQEGISIEFQEFHHPVYDQRFMPFIPCMSSIDLLFNHGPNSKDILQGGGVETIESIFT